MLAVSASLQCLSSEEEQSGSITSDLAIGDGWARAVSTDFQIEEEKKHAGEKRENKKCAENLEQVLFYAYILYVCFVHVVSISIYLYMFIT